MAALKSQGTSVSVCAAATSPLVYEAISQVVNWSGPDGSASEIDVTALDSAAKEFLMGLPDEGNLSIECIHDPNEASHETLRAARANQTLMSFQIALTDSPQTTYTVDGYVMGFTLSAGVDDKVGATYSIRLTGAVTKA